MIPQGPSMFSITCTCGHTADIELFTHPHGVELPPGHYQCPACHRAWFVQKTPVLIYGGRVFSEPNKIIPLPPIML